MAVVTAKGRLCGLAGPWQSFAENEVDRADHAQGRPQVVELQRLAHLHQNEWDEHSKRNDLLEYLELRQRHHCVPDAIGWNLEQVFE
jgi:hypothetical protein